MGCKGSTEQNKLPPLVKSLGTQSLEMCKHVQALTSKLKIIFLKVSLLSDQDTIRLNYPNITEISANYENCIQHINSIGASAQKMMRGAEIGAEAGKSIILVKDSLVYIVAALRKICTFSTNIDGSLLAISNVYKTVIEKRISPKKQKLMREGSSNVEWGSFASNPIVASELIEHNYDQLIVCFTEVKNNLDVIVQMLPNTQEMLMRVHALTHQLLDIKLIKANKGKLLLIQDDIEKIGKDIRELEVIMKEILASWGRSKQI